jgi:hypothetical protein
MREAASPQRREGHSVALRPEPKKINREGAEETITLLVSIRKVAMNSVGRAFSPHRGRMPLPQNEVSGWGLVILERVLILANPPSGLL